MEYFLLLLGVAFWVALIGWLFNSITEECIKLETEARAQIEACLMEEAIARHNLRI